MQRCPDAACGQLNRPSARFCERCGQPLRDRQWAPLSPGTLMRGGTYRILEPLGRGGMGALYLAADTGAFDRRCVVKELLDYYDPTDPAEARKAQSRFETEARLLAELSHPGIPRIYSYFSEAGRHYIVMEYIEGETLERAVSHVDAQGARLPARPLPPEEVVRHAVRVCRVLEYLATQPRPVIHHDIKPANLIVDRSSGEVRLVDFGTAQSRTPWATQARLGKRATSIFGTQGYASPEQFQGRSEPRSDVYALAATVYHLLTDDDPGDHPFNFPKLSTVVEPLADALSRALRPEVQRRSTATEFRQALEAWLIPGGATRPFVFRSGAVVHTPLELVAACDRNWPDARRHLQNGDFDAWFHAQNRHDLVAKAKSARLESDANAALEAFLRRLNPRLAPPRLAVEPQVLDFGRLSRGGMAEQRLRLRNESRGYGQAVLTASVPWLSFDPPEVGCMAGEEVALTVRLDAASLPLRREHQAVVAVLPARGARISIPAIVELSMAAEGVRRVGAGVAAFSRLAGRGARWGILFWTRAFRGLLQSRYGPWVLLAETVILDVGLVGLWWTWRSVRLSPGALLVSLLQALPLALAAVYLLPALAFASLGVLRESWQSRASRHSRRAGGRHWPSSPPLAGGGREGGAP